MAWKRQLVIVLLAQWLEGVHRPLVKSLNKLRKYQIKKRIIKPLRLHLFIIKTTQEFFHIHTDSVNINLVHNGVGKKFDMTLFLNVFINHNNKSLCRF